jgi:RNA-binding protein NOB1
MAVSFESVVLDANAFIAMGPTSLAGLASSFYTVQEAIDEVRDAPARHALSLLPFTLTTRIPAESSIAAVKEFARKTGDLARLSRTDLLLLALTHQLEVEANGAGNVRSEPPKVPTRAGLQSKREAPVCRFFNTSGGCRNGAVCRFQHLPEGAAAPSSGGEVDAVTAGTSVTVDAAASLGTAGDTASGTSGDLAASFSRLAVASTAAVMPPDVLSDPHSTSPHPPAAIASSLPASGRVSGDAIRSGVLVATAALPPVAAMSAVDIAAFTTDTLARVDAAELIADADGDGAWITPSAPKATRTANVVASSSTVSGHAAAPHRKAVVCVTSDFAMQNVLLQMGLLLASPQGKLVREVKTWVLKCDACFTITHKMDKLFCPTCGNATLARLGVSIGDDGVPSYHYKKHRDFNNRGTVFALPTPEGGRNGGGLLLREDQLLTGKWAQKVRERASEESLFGGGAASDSAPVSSGIVARSRAHPTHNPGIVVGYGRRNPNASRHRK